MAGVAGEGVGGDEGHDRHKGGVGPPRRPPRKRCQPRHNPAARNDPSSPIHGMPILNVDKSRSVIALKRSMNSGFAGIDNPLFYADGTTMLFGDAKKSVSEVAEELKAL